MPVITVTRGSRAAAACTGQPRKEDFGPERKEDEGKQILCVSRALDQPGARRKEINDAWG